MKKYITILLLFSVSMIFAADYTVTSIAEYNALPMSSGDVVTISGVINGQIDVTVEGVTIQGGTISGFETITGFSEYSSNIYSKTVDAFDILTFENNIVEKGHFPANLTTLADAATYNTLTDGLLSMDWTGAEIVIKNNDWTISKNEILSQSGTTVTFDPEIASYTPTTKSWWFIQNDVRTLAKNGDWAYRSGVLYVYSTDAIANHIIKVSTLDTAIYVTADNVTIDDVTITGINKTAINFDADNLTISNCTISQAGYGIYAATLASKDYLTVTGNTIKNCLNDGMYAYYGTRGTNYTITNNIVDSVGMCVGNHIDYGHALKFHGICLTPSSENNVQYNTVSNCVYSGIRFDANNATVKYNYIHNINYLLKDGGGLYTYAGATATRNSTISNNIIVDGGGVGLYADNNTTGHFFRENTVIRCNVGFGGNDVNTTDVSKNTFYLCETTFTPSNHGDSTAIPYDLTIDSNTIVNNSDNVYYFDYWLGSDVGEFTDFSFDAIGFGKFNENTIIVDDLSTDWTRMFFKYSGSWYNQYYTITESQALGWDSNSTIIEATPIICYNATMIPDTVDHLGYAMITADDDTFYNETVLAAFTSEVFVDSFYSSDNIYYIDATGGSDSNLGHTPEEAWKTLDKINNTGFFSIGDTVLFKRGETWSTPTLGGSWLLNVGNSGVYYGAYGSGSKPTLDATYDYTGWETSENWSVYDANIWTMSAASSPIRLFINDSDQKRAYNPSFIDSEYTWWYGGGLLYVYSETNPSTAFNSMFRSQGRQQAIRLYGVDDVIIENIKTVGSAYGIRLENGCDNIIIKNCEIGFRTEIMGIFSQSTGDPNTGLKIFNNIITSGDSLEYNYARDDHATFDGVWLNQGTTGAEVYNNYIYGWGHSGIQIESHTSAYPNFNNKVYNNYITAPLIDYGRGFGISVYYASTGNEVYNNIVKDCPVRSQIECNGIKFYENVIDNNFSSPYTANAQGLSIEGFVEPATNMEIKDNVFMNNARAGIYLGTFSGEGVIQDNIINSNTFINNSTVGLQINKDGNTTTTSIINNTWIDNHFYSDYGTDVIRWGLSNYNVSEWNVLNGTSGDIILGNEALTEIPTIHYTTFDSKTINFSGYRITDVDGNTYDNSVTLLPFTSLVEVSRVRINMNFAGKYINGVWKYRGKNGKIQVITK